MIYGVTYSNQRVSAADHAKLFRMVVGDGIMDGCGCSYRYDKFTISDGQFVACGRLTGIEGSEVIEIAGNSGYARIRGIIDMNQVAEVDAFGQFYWRVDYASTADGFTALTQEDINARGTIYEIEWAVVSLGEGGITGIVRQIANASGQSGGGGTGFPIYTFSGNDSDIEFIDDGNGDWRLKIFGSGDLYFTNLGNASSGIDVFLVGGGGGGSGRAGGGGGRVLTVSQYFLSRGNNYHLEVGEGGAGGIYNGSNPANGGSTSAFGYTADGGNAASGNTGGDGGSGGASYNGGNDSIFSKSGRALGGSDGSNGAAYLDGPSGQGLDATTREFGEASGALYAGGGCACSHNPSYLYIKSPQPDVVISGVGGASGYDGYGNNGNPTYGGENGAPNTGNGGGGGSTYSDGEAHPAGSGGSGIVIIRNHRSNPAA